MSYLTDDSNERMRDLYKETQDEENRLFQILHDLGFSRDDIKNAHYTLSSRLNELPMIKEDRENRLAQSFQYLCKTSGTELKHLDTNEKILDALAERPIYLADERIQQLLTNPSIFEQELIRVQHEKVEEQAKINKQIQLENEQRWINRDSDHDGIPDYMDPHPYTHAGSDLNNNGIEDHLEEEHEQE